MKNLKIVANLMTILLLGGVLTQVKVDVGGEELAEPNSQPVSPQSDSSAANFDQKEENENSESQGILALLSQKPEIPLCYDLLSGNIFFKESSRKYQEFIPDDVNIKTLEVKHFARTLGDCLKALGKLDREQLMEIGNEMKMQAERGVKNSKEYLNLPIIKSVFVPSDGHLIYTIDSKEKAALSSDENDTLAQFRIIQMELGKLQQQTKAQGENKLESHTEFEQLNELGQRLLDRYYYTMYLYSIIGVVVGLVAGILYCCYLQQYYSTGKNLAKKSEKKGKGSQKSGKDEKDQRISKAEVEQDLESKWKQLREMRMEVENLEKKVQELEKN